MSMVRDTHPHFGRDIRWVRYQHRSGKWWIRLMSGRYWVDFGYDQRPDDSVIPELKKYFIRHKRVYRSHLR